MADRGSANGTVQATGNGPGDQGAVAAEVNALVSQACSSDLAGGTFFTDISTVDTNCAILPLHPAQLSPLLDSSSREVSPVSSQRAGFNFGHPSNLTVVFYSSAAASPSTPISSGQGAAAAEVNVCVSQACSSDLTGGTFFTDISTVDTNCAILPLHPAQLSPLLDSSSREVSPVSSHRAQDISCGRPARRTDFCTPFGSTHKRPLSVRSIKRYKQATGAVKDFVRLFPNRRRGGFRGRFVPGA